jgi:hypothetical protein
MTVAPMSMAGFRSSACSRGSGTFGTRPVERWAEKFARAGGPQRPRPPGPPPRKPGGRRLVLSRGDIGLTYHGTKSSSEADRLAHGKFYFEIEGEVPREIARDALARALFAKMESLDPTADYDWAKSAEENWAALGSKAFYFACIDALSARPSIWAMAAQPVETHRQ